MAKQRRRGGAAAARTLDVLVNVDVPDLERAIAFYVGAFDLAVSRRIGADVAELSGWPVRLYLLEKPAGSPAAADHRRRYDRHWTPIHLDVVVGNIEEALRRAITGGAQAETAIRTEVWGKIVIISDPFGHGICLIEFLGRGYDEIGPPGDTGC